MATFSSIPVVFLDNLFVKLLSNGLFQVMYSVMFRKYYEHMDREPEILREWVSVCTSGNPKFIMLMLDQS